jgi:hypothetical protein
MNDDVDPSPARVVADADVLAADLLVDGAARRSLDELRSHSWTSLVASDALLAETTDVITAVASEELAARWRNRINQWREPVKHPEGDHPAVASAYRGGAMHVISFESSLTTVGAGTSLQETFPVSIREPDAFAAIFDPERLYPTVVGGDYPGPDRDPRS